MTDWPVKTLGDLLEVSIGGIWGSEAGEDEVDVFVYRSTELIKDGQLKDELTVRRSITARQLDSRKLEEGDLLLEKSGGGPKTPVGRVGLVKVLPGLSVCSNFMQLMRPRKKEVLPVYLHYFLNHFHVAGYTEDLQNNSTNIRNLKTTEYMEVEIPVPTLEEQKRIVALLDAATERVTELAACYEQARTHASDLLESLFLELFADAFKSYPKRKMGEVLQIARGGSPRPIGDYLTTSSDGINWIKIGDASASKKYIYETVQKIRPEGVPRSLMVYPGDFLLSNSMSFGRPYIMKTKGCIHDGWLVLRDSKGELEQDFLFYLLGSRFMYRKFSDLAAGSTVQNLNSALVSGVEIPVPPIDVQKKIAEQARALEESISQLNDLTGSKLRLAVKLRQSILEAAFAGDL